MGAGDSREGDAVGVGAWRRLFDEDTIVCERRCLVRYEQYFSYSRRASKRGKIP